jgi:hypothetical protein
MRTLTDLEREQVEQATLDYSVWLTGGNPRRLGYDVADLIEIIERLTDPDKDEP